METIACKCDGLPAHDHNIPNKRPIDMTEEELDRHRGPNAVPYVPYRHDPIDIGRLWVDWKAVARDLIVNP